jgi:hypothetical protein
VNPNAAVPLTVYRLPPIASVGAARAAAEASWGEIMDDLRKP